MTSTPNRNGNDPSVSTVERLPGGAPSNRSLPSRLFPNRASQVVAGIGLMLAFSFMTWVLYASLLAGYEPPTVEATIDAFAQQELDHAEDLVRAGRYREAIQKYNSIQMGWATNPPVMEVVKARRKALVERLERIQEQELEEKRQAALTELKAQMTERPEAFRSHLERIAELEEQYPKLAERLGPIRKELEERAENLYATLEETVNLHIALKNLSAAMSSIEEFRETYPGHPRFEDTGDLLARVRESAGEQFVQLEEEVRMFLNRTPPRYASARKACDLFIEQAEYPPVIEQAKALRAEIVQTLDSKFEAFVQSVRSGIDRFQFDEARERLEAESFTFLETHGEEIDRYRKLIPVLKKLHQYVVRRVRATRWRLEAEEFLPTPLEDFPEPIDRFIFESATENLIRIRLPGGTGTSIHWKDLPPEELERIYLHYIPANALESSREALETFRAYHGLDGD